MLEFQYPNVVYALNLTDKGDILELRNPVFENHYGYDLKVEKTGKAYDIIDLSTRLSSLGYVTAHIGTKKLYASKNGVHLHIIFSKYLAYENTTVKQLEITVENIIKERAEILNDFVEQQIARLGDVQNV